MRAQADESRSELEVKLAALESEIAGLRAREAASCAREAAGSRILQAIAEGPEDAARALDMIAESACTLCGACDATIRLRDGAYLVRGGHHGPIPTDVERLPVSPRFPGGRCVLERRPVHVHDLRAAGDEYPEGADMALRLGHRTIVGVPLLRRGEAIGSIVLRRFEVNPFSEDDIALLATFADQAVIAVENTRLFTALSARNREIAEALERQTATSEILSTISSSPRDVRPVFDAIANSAAPLCEAEFCHVFRYDGTLVEFVAHNYDTSSSAPSEATEVARSVFPMVPDAGSAAGRVLLTGSPVNIPDVHADPDYALGRVAHLLGYRSIMGVPMLREGRAIGAITVMRCQIGAFSDRQIDVLKTFADQAVIAIENVRMFKEVEARTRDVTEALERQTATSEILRAISTSMTDAQPVFEAIVRSAVSLCGSLFANVFRFDGGLLHFVASHNVGQGYVDLLREKYPMRPDPSQVSGRVVLSGDVVRLEDALADPDYDQRFPLAMRWRRMLGVPMLRGGVPVGVIVVGWAEAGSIPARQEELLKIFADQALIAIENARLFTELESRNHELREALEQQTATSAILRVIASSPTDLEPVLKAVAESAARLCGAADAQIFGVQGDMLHLEASFGSIPIHRKEKIDRGWVTGRSVVDRHTIHVRDLASEPESEFPLGREMQRKQGHRTTLATPLLKQGIVLGAILIRRMEVQPFSDEQIRLLETFADQAAIAIENARLFEAVQQRTSELQEALEQQTASGQILQAISSSPGDVQPVFETIVDCAARLCDAEFSAVTRFDGTMLHLAAVNNMSPGEIAAYRTIFPRAPTNDIVVGRCFLAGQPVQVEDVSADPNYDPRTLEVLRSAAPYRTYLGVPILLNGSPIGTIGLGRRVVRPFTDREIAIVQSFADQAVIAIENARLFEAVEARTRELQEALDYQTATSEVLGVISRSAFNLKRVFEAIGESALRLCGAERAFIFRYDGEVLRAIVGLNASSELATFVENHPIRPGRHTATARAALERRTVHIEDVEADPEFTYGARDIDPLHTTLSVPILKGDALLGVITIYKLEVEVFTPKQIALLETFADQAAIAIENARLFEDLKAALAEFNAVLDNIDYGVLFMDRDLRTRIVNPALRRLWDIPQQLIDQRPTMRELLEYNRDRGVYTTPPEEWDEWVARRIERVREGSVPPGEFVRADGKVYSYQCVMLPDGGRMLSYFDITELKNRQAELLKAKEAAEAALAELRTAQERLVQSEKLASLGQLTAGIAHEIKNPLNFVNNFASLSRDLLVELEAVLQAPIAALAAAERDDAEDLLRTVRENLDKIVHHGKRADSIVRNMLLHARHGSGEWRSADINAIAEEALNLAYHGARAGHPDFNVEIAKHLDPDAGAIECCPQDIMRVILNLVSNGIYAANMKRPSAPVGFVPRIELTTSAGDAGIALEVRDNGTGIPDEIRESIFLPFFTTKPAGEGTGLGLSLSHDIVVKQHGGSIAVESEPGAFTSFRLVLPRHVVTERRAGA